MYHRILVSIHWISTVLLSNAVVCLQVFLSNFLTWFVVGYYQEFDQATTHYNCALAAEVHDFNLI